MSTGSLLKNENGLQSSGPEDAQVSWTVAYGEATQALRVFLDDFAVSRPDKDSLTALTECLKGWSQTLTAAAVEERQQVFGRQRDLAGSGQTMVPKFEVRAQDRNSLSGVAVFGRYFRGAFGAAHGGAIPLLLDDVIGRLANSGNRPLARTVSLRTDYRSITPIGPELDVRAWIVSEEGRKRIVRGEIRHNDKLCAEAECLLVTLLPGQQ